MSVMSFEGFNSIMGMLVLPTKGFLRRQDTTGNHNTKVKSSTLQHGDSVSTGLWFSYGDVLSYSVK